jgi:hypothetical protein
MLKKTITTYICLFLSLKVLAFVNPVTDKRYAIFKEPLSNRIVGYEITANIDTKKHLVKGKEKIFWYNNTKKAVNTLHFHLYMNGFSANNTKLTEGAKESGLIQYPAFSRETAGYTKVTSISANFSNLTDDFKVDETVATLELPYRINPGESILLEIDFETKLPKIAIRAGYAGSFHMLAQWFPKLGVLNDKGEWECNRYSVNGEFFADFGVYKCTFTFPKTFKIIGTGIKAEEHISKNSKTVTMYAEDVHDAAFVLWDKFKVKSKNINGKKLCVYYCEGYEKESNRVMSALTKAFNWYEKNIFPYPYPSYFAVCVPFNGLNAGGMEYPMFSTTIVLNSLPEFVHITEEITIHEFGHSFFGGIAANNENTEGWLDEGLNTYLTAVIMEQNYGQCSLVNNPFLCKSSFQSICSHNFSPLKFEYPGKPAGAFASHNGYSLAIYNKTALLLKTIENYIGRDSVINALSAYTDKFAFKHPKGKDFIKILNEETGESFNNLIDKVIYSEYFPDAMVLKVSSSKINTFKGFVQAGDKIRYLQEEKNENKVKHTVVFGKREMPLSVNYKILLSDGNELKGFMAGDETIKKIEFITDSKIKVVEAWIDYDKKAAIDLDRNNNRYNKSKSEILTPVTSTLFLILLEWISYVF